jgi:hypothetical protein
LIAVETKITGEGYVGIPSFRVSFQIQNVGNDPIILPRVYYELFTGSDGNFLGSGEAFKRGPGDSETDMIYLCPNCDTGVASIFELDDRKIGLVEKARAGEDARFRVNLYANARIRVIGQEGDEKTTYKRLTSKVETSVPEEEWEAWLGEWLADQRVLLVRRETLDRLDRALEAYDMSDYDQLIQALVTSAGQFDTREKEGAHA